MIVLPTMLGLHLMTAHLHSGYESITPGIYARYESCATVGMYRNSVGRWSAYVGCTVEAGRFAVTMGGVTGYGFTVAPMMVPSVRLNLGQGSSLRIAIVPQLPHGSSAAVHFAFEREF